MTTPERYFTRKMLLTPPSSAEEVPRLTTKEQQSAARPWYGATDRIYDLLIEGIPSNFQVTAHISYLQGIIHLCKLYISRGIALVEQGDKWQTAIITWKHAFLVSNGFLKLEA